MKQQAIQNLEAVKNKAFDDIKVIRYQNSFVGTCLWQESLFRVFGESNEWQRRVNPFAL